MRIFYILFIVVLGGCNLFNVHPYVVSDDTATDINERNIIAIQTKYKNRQEMSFAWIGDSQRWYDETKDCVDYINENLDVDFVVHGGDMSDFGMEEEYEWVYRELKRLTKPFLALVGNHDLIGNGWKVYKRMYGDDNFYFSVGNVRFICLNTNAIEFDYSYPIPDYSFIEEQIADSAQYERSVVLMHSSPLSEQFTPNTSVLFHETIREIKGVMFAANAHGHCTYIKDLFDDGFMYYQCASMKKRSFLVFTISPNGYTYEEHFF